MRKNVRWGHWRRRKYSLWQVEACDWLKRAVLKEFVTACCYPILCRSAKKKCQATCKRGSPFRETVRQRARQSWHIAHQSALTSSNDEIMWHREHLHEDRLLTGLYFQKYIHELMITRLFCGCSERTREVAWLSAVPPPPPPPLSPSVKRSHPVFQRTPNARAKMATMLQDVAVFRREWCSLEPLRPHLVDDLCTARDTSEPSTTLAKKIETGTQPNIGACMLDRSRACATCARLVVAVSSWVKTAQLRSASSLSFRPHFERVSIELSSLQVVVDRRSWLIESSASSGGESLQAVRKNTIFPKFRSSSVLAEIAGFYREESVSGSLQSAGPCP